MWTSTVDATSMKQNPITAANRRKVIQERYSILALLSGPLPVSDAVEPDSAGHPSPTRPLTQLLKRTLLSQRFRSVPRQERAITSLPKQREPLGLHWIKRPASNPVESQDGSPSTMCYT